MAFVSDPVEIIVSAPEPRKRDDDNWELIYESIDSNKKLDWRDFEEKLIVPNSRLHWLIRQVNESERMGQVDMTLEELGAVLTELAMHRE
jgi:hypothetical protein